MVHYVKVVMECKHKKCETHHIDTLVEAPRIPCCEEHDCVPEVLPCVEKLEAT